MAARYTTRNHSAALFRGEDTQVNMSLFPSAQAIRRENQESPHSQSRGTDLNWLTNASYKGDADSVEDVIKAEKRDAAEDVKNYEERNKSRSPHSVSRERHKKLKEKKPSRHKERKDKERSRHGTSKRRDRSRSRSSSRERAVTSGPASFWLDDQKNPAETLFFIDSKSDRNNLSFDSVHYSDAAFYRTLGRTCLGGTGLNPDIFYEAGGKAKSKVKSFRQGRYFSRRGATKSTDETVDMSHVISRKSEQEEKHPGFSEKREIEEKSADPFIAIESTTSRSVKLSKVSELDPMNLYDRTTRQYLGIIPQEDGEASANSKAEEALKKPMTERIASFNSHLGGSPNDIPKWIEFINFQEELVESELFGQSAGKQGHLRNPEQLLVQRKLAILEKALQKNPGCLRLQLEQVEICRNHWDSGKVSDLWEQMLGAHPGEFGLWRHYLLYRQSSYSTFSISKVATLFADCIQDLLKSMGDGDERKISKIEENLLEVFVQLCHFWHQSGHTEKAVAAFQAMIELNIFCPENPGEASSLPSQLALLETFWDSDEPKFGEAGARGWSHWMHLKMKGGWQNTPPPQSTGSEDEGDSLDPSLSKVQAWLGEESRRGSQEFLPWRPDPSKGQSADDCEDPDRLVLFDDIGKALFRVTSDHLKWQLILSFFEFLGISTESMLTTNSQRTHHFLSSTLQSSNEVTGSKFAINGPEEDPSSVDISSSWHSAWHKSCPGILHSYDGLCISEREGGRECKLDKGNTDKQAAALSRFVDNGIDQLTAVVSQGERAVLRKLQLRFHLTKLTLSGEAKKRKKQMKTIQRIAKKTLSLESNRNDLALWETYALWEWYIGNLKESQRVFETALTFAGVPTDEEGMESYMRLVHTISTLKLHSAFGACGRRPRYRTDPASGEVHVDSGLVHHEVLNYLATLGEGVKFLPLPRYHDSSVTSGRILKARKRFVELLEEARMEYSPIVGPSPAPVSDAWVVPSGSSLYHLCNCYAIFQYLTVSLQAASVVYQDMLAFIDQVPQGVNDAGSSLSSTQSEIDRELLTLAQVQLLSYHSAVNPVPLAALRDVLQRALSRYPSNPALMEVFLQTEGTSHVMGRLRRHFHRAVEVTESPVPMFYAITSELRRQRRIEKEIDRDDGVSLSETGLSHHIRSLFERAVRMRHTRHCILFWRMFIQFEVSQSNMKNAKTIFYRALQHCPWSKVLYMDMIRYFPGEAEEFIDLMMEKEVRVRVPLEEIELLMSPGS